MAHAYLNKVSITKYKKVFFEIHLKYDTNFCSNTTDLKKILKDTGICANLSPFFTHQLFSVRLTRLLSKVIIFIPLVLYKKNTVKIRIS